jgi:hypothetical protein
MGDNEDRKNGVYSGLAVHDFQRAYQRSFFRAILNKIAGKETDLLSFNMIKHALDIKGETDKGMQEVEIEKIIGSLNRYEDFDDSFLPKQTYTRDRWQQIDRALMRGENLPPIDLYKIGDFYFVIDGNHRVSVAKEKGQKFIDAHVRELKLPFSITGEFNWQKVLLKQEKRDFLKKTHLDELRPDLDIDLTLAGQYHRLLEHIDVHRYYISQNDHREVPYQEAVEKWLQDIYLPMIEVIREQGIMDDFPERTESDLYLWIIEHLAYIRNRYPFEIGYREAASDFSREHESIFQKFIGFFKGILGKK